MFASLPTDEPHPLRRLERVHAEMNAAKARHSALPATLLQDANHLIPPALFGRAARASMAVASQPQTANGANLLISNVPGSPVPLYMAGARLVAQYPVSAIFHNMALNITVLSYLDQVDWGFVCDEGQDAWGLVDAADRAQAELVELAEAAGAEPKRSSVGTPQADGSAASSRRNRSRCNI